MAKPTRQPMILVDRDLSSMHCNFATKMPLALRALALSAFLLSGSASSQFVDPFDDPTRTLGVLKITPAYSQYWEAYVMKLDEAQNALGVTAVGDGCADLGLSRWNLIAPVRAAMEDVIAFNSPSPTQLADPQFARYSNRSLLFAQSKLTEQEQRTLTQYLRDTEMLTFVGGLSALTDFEGLWLIGTTGEIEPASVIWLKTYFEREGNLAALRRAMGKVDAQMVGAFDRVKRITDHGPADAEDLQKVVVSIQKHLKAITKAYVDQTDPSIVARARAFDQHRVHRYIRQARISGRLSPTGLELAAKLKSKSQLNDQESLLVEAAAIHDELERDYPTPVSVAKERARVKGPPDFAGPQAAKICPLLRAQELTD